MRRPLWRHPALLSLGVVLAVLAAALGWTLLHALQSPPLAAAGAAAVGGLLPWEVRTPPDGRSAEVFGVAVGQATLGDLQARFGDELAVGLIAPIVREGESDPGAPALEAFVDGLRAGFVTGRLVLALEADAGWRERARGRSPAHDVGEGGRSRRFRLSADDLAAARSARVVALTFLPSLRLDEAMVVQRFGEPAERLAVPGGESQLLYPAQGVAVALPPASGDQARAKALIQYVAPAEFEVRLHAPLRAAAASAASAATLPDAAR